MTHLFSLVSLCPEVAKIGVLSLRCDSLHLNTDVKPYVQKGISFNHIYFGSGDLETDIKTDISTLKTQLSSFTITTLFLHIV